MGKFNSKTYGELDYDGIVEKIADFIKEDQNFRYKVIVGSDSETRHKVGDFVTAIIVHRIGKGGIYFWQRDLLTGFVSIADRIAKETQLSIDLAWKLRDTFRHNGLSAYEPEVHIDVGEGGITRDMIRWVTGMVRGSGFNFKIKPEAYAASTVADKHT